MTGQFKFMRVMAVLLIALMPILAANVEVSHAEQQEGRPLHVSMDLESGLRTPEQAFRDRMQLARAGMQPELRELFATVFEPAPAPEPQTAARNNFTGATTITATGTSNPTGTVNILCGGSTCAAGVYHVDLAMQTATANTTQTSPNASATFGWTGPTGAVTSAATAPGGGTTMSTATTGTVFSAGINVRTTGALSVVFAMSGTTGSQTVNYDVSARRIR